MKKILLVLISITIFGCTTPSDFFDKQYNYKKVVNKNTKTDKKYSGINNLYELSATHLNHDVLSLKNQKMAFMQQWPSHKIEEASQKQEESLSKTTQFLVVFYTPNTQQNDLSKGQDSIWRIYLKVDNQRFQGVANVIEENANQLKSLIPNTSRFSKIYRVEFPIASNETDQASDIELILTSDVGSSTLKFK